MVWVPPGPFIYGEGEDTRVVRLEQGFFVAQAPVTNAEFARFVEVTGYVTTAEKNGGGDREGIRFVKGFDWRHPEGPESGIEGQMDHPVVQVSWHDAATYAEWAGVRLLTEQEGKRQRVGSTGERIPGETGSRHLICAISVAMRVGQRLWAITRPRETVPTAALKWRATSGSGQQVTMVIGGR